MINSHLLDDQNSSMVIMRRLPPLSALRAFEASARHLSFKAAAMELNVTPTAISHRIKALEDFLGMALFDRHIRRVTLNEAGVQLYPVVRDGFDSFEKAFHKLAEGKKRARVTISATRAFAAKWLVPRVANFQKCHPGIDLQIHASDDAVRFEDGNIDIAIRYGRGPYSNVCEEVMFTDHFAPVMNPSLGSLNQDDLASIPHIEFSWSRSHPLNPTWARWYEVASLKDPPPPSELVFSDESHAIQAAIAGHGIALVSLALVNSELTAGHLIQPFQPTVPGHTYHLLMRQGQTYIPEVEAVAAWLRCEVGLMWPEATLRRDDEWLLI